MSAIDQIGEEISGVLLVQQVQLLAICQLLRQSMAPGSEASRTFCKELREAVDENLMKPLAERPNSVADAAVTLQLAAILEAAGEPPAH